MKTNLPSHQKIETRAPRPPAQRAAEPWGVWMLLLLASLVLVLDGASPAKAEVPAPDNVLYGVVVLGGQPVTAAQTGVVIEARRLNGLPVARYRMGTRPDAGNFYLLAISLEEAGPVRHPVAVLTNEMLRIVVVSNGTDHAQASFQIAERGQVTRLDFGTVPLSGFEEWAFAHGLPAGSGQLDADGDGFSNLQEYIAGTDPGNPNSRFALVIAQSVNTVEVSFLALRAEGAGYANQTRHYRLEGAPVLSAPTNAWASLPGFSNIIGGGQSVRYAIPATNVSPAFFRGRVELQSP